MTWQHGVAVFVGAGTGGVLRWLLVVFGDARLGTAFPWGTLVANTVGSFTIGAIAGYLVLHASPFWRLFWMVGVLGGFTTFSAFSLQTVEMAIAARWVPALLYVALSLVLCVGAAVGGVLLGRTLV